MSVGILSRPVKSGCNWNALGNPVIFKVEREDYPTAQVNNNGGFYQLQHNTNDITAYFQVGNTVFFTTNSATVTGTGTVTASIYSGGNTLITLDLAYAGGTLLGGFANNISKRTDYRVEYNFKSIAGVALLAANQTVSPIVSPLMRANASLLKNLLSATWTLPVSVNEVDSTGSIEFYISYQEYYDGALQGSVTNDSGNPIQGLLGSNQIGGVDGSNMLAYFIGSSTKKWLTRFQLNSTTCKGLKMWRDWPFTLSFIHPDSISNLYLRVIQYDVSGTQLDTTRSLMDPAFDNEINRIKFDSLFSVDVKRVLMRLVRLVAGSYSSVTITNGSFTGSLSPWVNSGVSGTDWTFSSAARVSNLIGIGQISKSLMQTLATPVSGGIDGFIKMTIDISIPNTKSIDIRIDALSAANPNPQNIGFMNAVIGDGSSHVQVITSIAINVTQDITQLGFSVFSNDSSVGNIDVTDVSFQFTPADVYTETLDIEVDDVCEYDEDNLPIPGQNPIMLQWKNSLGGDAQWLFPFHHEASYNVKGYKAKRILLFAQDLSAVQWEAIQELNSANEIVRVPVIDLENTNTVISTSKQVGKQVYIVGKDGNKTGVVVIPNSDKITARDPSHRAAIEIELPEFFEA